MSLLEVNGLCVRYGDSTVLDKLSFAVGAGEAVGLVGESGAGKTQAALAIMGLLPATAEVEGRIAFDGESLLLADEVALNRVRARQMAMVFQDPRRALNPYLTIGAQLRCLLEEHGLARGAAAAKRSLELLRQVGLPDPEQQLRAYPHQLSGGMRQRALIAAALAGEPRLLVADEPTTALDVTVQAQILALLASLRARYGLATLLISHDLGVIAGNSERMLVLDQGRIVEEGMTAEAFRTPRHPRTRAMLAQAVPLQSIPPPTPPPAAEPLITAHHVSVSYRVKPFAAVLRRLEVPAVRDASLAIRPGESLALVGESGSGKTSLVQALLGLLPLAKGHASFLGEPMPTHAARRPKALCRAMQLVFQDPVASLNPAMRVRDIVAEPLSIHEPSLGRADRMERVEKMLAAASLAADIGTRFPRQLSGGQAQRVALARALVVRPQLLVLDEAVAALDSEVRATVLALLEQEQREHGLALVLVSHDLGVVRRLAHRVLVMYNGRICEDAPAADLFTRPRHPYTRALIDAVPPPDPAASLAEPLDGEVPSLLSPPPGCPFHPRCRHAQARCRESLPALQEMDEVRVACHRADELDLRLAPAKAG